MRECRERGRGRRGDGGMQREGERILGERERERERESEREREKTR